MLRTTTVPAPSRPAAALVRFAVLDDHPVVRAGLRATLTPALGLVYVGGAADEHALWPLLHRTRPDVLLLDLHHPGRNGLTLSALVARLVDGPSIVLHPAVPSDAVRMAAALAGVTATVGKAAPSLELAATLRSAALGSDPAPVGAGTRRRLLDRLDDHDHGLVAMRLAGASVSEIAEVLGTTREAIGGRLDAAITRLAGIDARGGVEHRSRRSAASA